jgi:cytochrome P450
MRKMSVPDIPGPEGPALILKIPEIQRNPLEFMLKMIDRYGNFVQFPIGSRMVYLVNNPQDIKHILLDNHHNYSKDTIQYNQLARVTGRGLLTSDGDYWLRQRRLAQPAFHRARIEPLDQMIGHYTGEMLNRWQMNITSGKALDIDQEMMKLTLRIVGQALFSIDLHEQASDLTQAVLEALDYIVYRSQTILALPEYVPTPRNRRFNAAIRVLDDTVYTMIAERRKNLSPPADLLTRFLQSHDQETGASMNDAQIRDEIMTILIAGHETVASALTWCLYLLSQNPHVQRRIDLEIQEVLGNTSPDRVTITRLNYLRAVFTETLRMYPPAWLITRRALGRDQFNNWQTPENSLFIISPYVVHRNEQWWPDSEVFDPERFAEDSPHEQRFSYIPFGGGPRLCIGDRLAMYEAVLILAMINQHYHLELAPGYPVEMVPLVTLRPKTGLHMLVTEK